MSLISATLNSRLIPSRFLRRAYLSIHSLCAVLVIFLPIEPVALLLSLAAIGVSNVYCGFHYKKLRRLTQFRYDSEHLEVCVDGQWYGAKNRGKMSPFLSLPWLTCLPLTYGTSLDLARNLGENIDLILLPDSMSAEDGRRWRVFLHGDC